MDKDLHVKIADFGFAREVNSGTPSNLTFCGSEFFEAPEIMFCMDYDERIDVFSFGEFFILFSFYFICTF